MTAIGHFIVRHRLLIVAVLVAATGLLGWRATKLEEDLSFESLYASGNDEAIAFANAFSDQFESVNDMVAIVVTGGDLFTPECLHAVDRATHRLEQIEHVDVVYSLTNIRYIHADEGMLDVNNLIDELPDTDAEAAKIKRRVMGYGLIRGRLISDDGRYLAIVVQTEDIIDKPASSYVAELLRQLGEDNPTVVSSARASLIQMRGSLDQLLLPGDEQTPHLFDLLADGDAQQQQRATKELAAAGPGLLRTLTLADRRELIARIESIASEEIPSEYTIHVSGTNVIERDFMEILRKDEVRFFMFTAVVLIAVFYFSFRRLRETLIAYGTLTLAAICAAGSMQLMGGVIDIINSVVMIMVMVVGTSNVIHMVHGFCRGWRDEDGPAAGKEAAVRMVGSVGFACMMASLTTAGGFFSLYFARIGTVSHFGLNMAVAILVTYVVSLLVLTLAFSTIRTAPRMPAIDPDDPDAVERLLTSKAWLDRALKRLALLVIDHWVLTTTICTLFVVAFALGFMNLYAETHAVAELAEDSQTKINVRALEHLAGFIGFELSVRSTTGEALLEPETLAKIDQLQTYLEKQPETLRTWSVIDYLKAMNHAALGGGPDEPTLPDSADAADQLLLLYGFSVEGMKELEGLISEDRQWIRIVSRVHDVGANPYLRLRDRVEERARELFPDGDVEVRVTSEMCLQHVAMAGIVDDVASSISWAFVLVGVLMALSLRSWRLGLVALLPNVIPLLATLGLMGLTGIALRVGTIVVFSMGLGIAVDDTIHYLLCYRRQRARSSGYREAVLRSSAIVGRPMILTSVALILGFLGAAPATFKSISHMGILNAFAIAAALAADLVVTPLLLRIGESLSRGETSAKAVPPTTRYRSEPIEALENERSR